MQSVVGLQKTAKPFRYTVLVQEERTPQATLPNALRRADFLTESLYPIKRLKGHTAPMTANNLDVTAKTKRQ